MSLLKLKGPFCNYLKVEGPKRNSLIVEGPNISRDIF